MEAVGNLILRMQKEGNRMDFNLDDLVSSACGAVADAAEYVCDEVSDAADYLFGTDSDDSDSSDYSESGDDNSDSSDSSDSSTDGSDYSQSGDDSSDSSDSEYIGDNISCQVADGAGAVAVVGSVGEDGESDIDDVEEFFEDKFKLLVGAFIGAEELQEQSNENEYNKIAADEEELENLQKQSDEMIQQQTDKEIEDAKDEYNNMVDGSEVTSDSSRDTLITVGPSYAISDGYRSERTVQAVYNKTNPDFDIVETDGSGIGSLSCGAAWTFGIVNSEGGIPGVYGGGYNGGASAEGQGLDFSHSSSSDAATYSVAASTDYAAPEVHASETNSYSLIGGSVKAHGEQLKEFKDEYIQYEYEKDQITDQTSQQSDQDKTAEDIKNAPFVEMDKWFNK